MVTKTRAHCIVQAIKCPRISRAVLQFSATTCLPMYLFWRMLNSIKLGRRSFLQIRPFYVLVTLLHQFSAFSRVEYVNWALRSRIHITEEHGSLISQYTNNIHFISVVLSLFWVNVPIAQWSKASPLPDIKVSTFVGTEQSSSQDTINKRENVFRTVLCVKDQEEIEVITRLFRSNVFSNLYSDINIGSSRKQKHFLVLTVDRTWRFNAANTKSRQWAWSWKRINV
jgi:hypothetical protein